MEIIRKNFPSIMLDNDENLLSQFEGIISSVDELASLEIVKTLGAYKFRLAPSSPQYTDTLLQEILVFFNFYKIHLDISKSIRSSGVIVFSINI